MASWLRRILPFLLALALLGGLTAVALPPGPSLAHPERATQFPDPGTRTVPRYRRTGERHVVCKRDSGRRLRRAFAGRPRALRARLRLLRQCEFRHVQAAVNAASTGDRIAIMPGVYREQPSRRVPYDRPGEGRCGEHFERVESSGAPPPAGPRSNDPEYRPTYEHQRRCPNSRNLIAVIGDSDGDSKCDAKCDLQMEGLGRRARDVRIVGDRVKDDVIRADRADGFHLRRVTVEQAAFNGVNVIETNGFRVDRVVARWNDYYGVLTFTSDHGLYDRVEAYGNGDSGVYPGSAAEGGCTRFSTEIRRVNAHHNVLGYSGTAGNSVWVHDSRFHHNSAGLFTDSFASGHPGMPQDCARWERNLVYSNNVNYFAQPNQDYCANTQFKERRRAHVCPQFQVPVGTGMGIAGGNSNVLRANRTWDNWRWGVYLISIPASSRGEGSLNQFDTSHGNRFLGNVMGIDRRGRRDRNGTDFWWDEGGRGNCWAGNRGPAGVGVTSDPSTLPSCSEGGSNARAPDPARASTQVPCAAWDPARNQSPPGCDWFVVPPEPR